MPTYEYECTSCGQHIEVFQRISEDPLTVCGVCGGRLRKGFHPAGIVFKGSGFYATDSRKAAASSESRASKDSKDSKKEPAAGSSSSSSEGASSSSGSSSEGSSSKAPTPTKESSS